jgi:hypothetical protein
MGLYLECLKLERIRQDNYSNFRPKLCTLLLPSESRTKLHLTFLNDPFILKFLLQWPKFNLSC